MSSFQGGPYRGVSLCIIYVHTLCMYLEILSCIPMIVLSLNRKFVFFPAAKEIKGHELLILSGIVIIQRKFSINFARNICYPQYIIIYIAHGPMHPY